MGVIETPHKLSSTSTPRITTASCASVWVSVVTGSAPGMPLPCNRMRPPARRELTEVSDRIHSASKMRPIHTVARGGNSEDCMARCVPRISTQIMNGPFTALMTICAVGPLLRAAQGRNRRTIRRLAA